MQIQVGAIGCLHLGHENMAKWRGFSSATEHDEYLIQEWNKVVGKRSLIFILGDITMETSKHYHLLDRLNGRKKVVLGNHDKGRDVPELLKYVEEVAGMVHYKGGVLTHCPIHPMEMDRYRFNCHAHIHYEDVPDNAEGKYIHVDAARIGFKPMSFEELIKPN